MTEFQNRENEHDDFLIWVENTSIYEKQTNASIVESIDYITCATEELAESSVLQKEEGFRQFEVLQQYNRPYK